MHGSNFDNFDGQEFGEETVRAIKGYVERKCAALEAKIALLEARAIPKYLGVYRSGATYSEGSMVTRDGSVFHANKTTREMPGDGCQDWTLAVKHGERGRDGKVDAK
jgi:hypothetical protein